MALAPILLADAPADHIRPISSLSKAPTLEN
jgi:hypothetical protein